MKQNFDKMTRRALLKRSAAVAAASVAAPFIIPSSALGRDGAIAPSERITMGLIGHGMQMGGHRNTMLGRSEVQVLAVCDVKKWQRDAAQAQVERAYAKDKASGKYKGCDSYNEFERIIERKDIDACMVITPDHWHAMMSIAAMRSGKDVYVEKPMTLAIREGRLMSDSARKYGTILQVGSQQRSERAFRKAAEIVRNGWIGKVNLVYANLGRFAPEKAWPEEAIPEGFDYDRWLGPAPWHPYNEQRVKGDYGGGWRCFYDYGARKNGDWGAHHFDIIQWALGMDNSGPVEFIPKGYNGTEYQTHIYANGVRVLRDVPGTREMITFIGENGTVEVSRGGRLRTSPAELADLPLGPNDIHLYESNNHHSNWLEGIRTRRRTVADVEIGHRTATVCHLNSIAERIGRPVKWNPETEEVIGDEATARWVDRPMRAPWRLI